MAKGKKAHEKWEKTRLIGRKRFVLRNGMLGYGLPMFVVMEIFMPPLTDGSLDITKLVVRLAAWALAGYVFGALAWYLNEKDREKRINKGM